VHATLQVYEHLVFPGTRHVSLRSLPGMADRCLRVGSAGKTFSFTAWKVGGAAPLLLSHSRPSAALPASLEDPSGATGGAARQPTSLSGWRGGAVAAMLAAFQPVLLTTLSRLDG
jgi:hypothetical protein